MRLSLRWKIVAPLLLIVQLTFGVFVLFFRIQAGIERMTATQSRMENLRLDVTEIARDIQSSILIGDERYAVDSTKNALKLFEEIEELSSLFPHSSATTLPWSRSACSFLKIAWTTGADDSRRRSTLSGRYPPYSTGGLDIRTKDKLGELAGHFNRFVGFIGGMIATIKAKTGALQSQSAMLKDCVESLDSSLNNLGRDVESIFESFQQNAAVAEEVKASVAELTKHMQNIVNFTLQVGDLGMEASQAAEKGNSAVEETVAGRCGDNGSRVLFTARRGLNFSA